MTSTTFSGSNSHGASEQRAALEQRVAELSQRAAAATADREAAEAQFAGARAAVGSLENAFVAAEAEFKAVAAGPRATTLLGPAANDRKLEELRSQEASLRRKHEEAAQASAQFKTVLEFAQRTRAQAEFSLGQLKAQLETLTAEVAMGEQRAAEERAAEERAARERNAAEEKAIELARAHEKMTMELAMYEEQVSEQNMARRELETQQAVAKAKLEQIVPQYTAARERMQTLENALRASIDAERSTYAERDRALEELRTFDESSERLLIEERLASLRDAEDRAARELAEAELELRRLREAEEFAAVERVRLERGSGLMALPSASPSSAPMHAMPASPPAESQPQAAIPPAPPAPLTPQSSIAGRIASESPAAEPAAAAAVPEGPQPLRLTSLEDRRDQFTFFKWGRREVPALAPPPESPNGGQNPA